MDISPDKQNIDTLFSNTTYYIDFYQREYKWTKEPVERLLEDIFYKFNLEYPTKKTLDPGKETIMAHYSWYYLNTYVTNTIAGKVYVVDGQQRLTTLTLILIKLLHICKKYKSRLEPWVERKIVGFSGFENEFWMNHEKHKRTLQSLLEGEADQLIQNIDTSSGITAENILSNYITISKKLELELSDSHKSDTFIFYFLYRLVLINLNVEQTDVPMVFEVINDRGVKLKPYEIIKGKLLGQIDKIELDKQNLNELWDTQVKSINDLAEDEIDEFFKYYLRAKYANTRAEAQKFDEDYHKTIFKDEINERLTLKHNPIGVKTFLKKDFLYYTNLYRRILEYYFNYHHNHPYVFYNKLNELDNQFLLILSGCSINDEKEEEKISVISYELDRLFCLLHLQRSYDSNKFNEAVFGISNEIREKDVSEYRFVFDKYLMAEISIKRNIEINTPLQYSYFKDVGVELNARFKRYFFARIEKFLADNMKLKMKHDISDLVLKTGSVNGFHIEHILAFNDENITAFKDDEDLFERERNRLGGLLLLKGRDNQSSNDEVYTKKLKSYANTLYWNETLRSDSYKSKLDFSEFIQKYQLNVRAMDSFGQEELEERSKLLFDMVKIIWQ